ncbi:uncharacterized protein LOC114754341 [Neltuma alba]|uniref:uncharacterized protein LOC114754341 n=1 Tax=Neltuma alba TaxID=207710 RepID=UPI0010A2EE67|nr:uncharacterized protein LOC114754341 [Prosopis alba]
MGETAQQSVTEKAPIHTSPNFTVLPTRDNTHASAKIFEEEEEEEESLITSRRARISGMKSSSSLSKEESKTSIDAGPTVTIVSSEQTSEVILPLSPMSTKVSTSLSQSLSTVLPKPSNDDVQASNKSLGHATVSSGSGNIRVDTETTTTQFSDDCINQDSKVWEETEQNLFSHTNGRQALEPQQPTTGSSNFTRDELVGKVARNERTMIDPQQSTLGSHNFTKDESVNKEVKTESIMMEPQSKEEMTRHGIQCHEDEEEEEERKGGLITTRHRQSDIKAKNSFLKEKPKTSIHGDPFVPSTTTISSELTSKAILPPSPNSSKALLCKPTDDIQVSDKSHATVIGDAAPIPQPTTLYEGINSDKDINGTDVIQDESKANMAFHGVQLNSNEHVTDDPSNLTQMEQELSCSRGQIKHPAVTKSSNINTEHAQSSLLPFSTPSESAPSVLETDQALNVSGVQEINEMVKLEGSEISLLAQALKTHPQLCMSTNDRSTQMLRISYRVLIDILNILTTRTPFTITEADKRSLEEKLKDACLLGFDKDWLESIRTKVFNCDVSKVNEIQETLKGLDSDLNTNEALLAATRNQGVKAARLVQKDLDAALQEHANVMANHTQLLKARQEILARQNQCWEMIAAKNKHFGF